jgi:murein DD-endopeptidase MepM/ murein hydrolase activator NlpD
VEYLLLTALVAMGAVLGWRHFGDVVAGQAECAGLALTGETAPHCGSEAPVVAAGGDGSSASSGQAALGTGGDDGLSLSDWGAERRAVSLDGSGGAPSIREPVRSAPVSSEYGWRNDPHTGEREFHDGIDYAAPEGTPIRAAADGVIRHQVPDHEAAGNFIVVEHEDGYRTRYLHMSGFEARRGQRVQAGEVIGYVGSTGRSTGPHLHFEVMRDGDPLNPESLYD